MKKKNGNGNGNSGFTLLEVILSIAILGMITVPLMKYFSDSLRYTALTARQQKATMLAQETIESLKVQDKLINRTADPAGNLYYWVTTLAGRDETQTDGEYQTVDASGFDKNNGTTASGKPLILSKQVTRGDLEYDVVLTLSTDVDANSVARPVIFGVDDTRNVMIVERDQEQEALLYFLALNTSYVVNHGGDVSDEEEDTDETEEGDGLGGGAGGGAGGGGAPVVELLGTVEKVRELLQRDIYITIGKEAVDPYYYTVTAQYVYSCSKVTDKAVDILPTITVMDTRIQNLESIYLLFNIVDPESDTIHLKWDTVLPASTQVAPEFMLVCQNLNQLNGGDVGDEEDPPVQFEADQYTLKIDLDGFGGWPGSSPVIRTNILNDDPIKTKGTLIRGDGSDLQNVNPLTATSQAIRIVEMEVAIYNGGDYALGNEPLVVMKTTKGE